MKELFIFWVFCSLAGNFLAERLPLIQQATFLSTSFENIFTWKIQEGSPPGTLYEVQFKKYGDAWQSKAECQNTTQLFCNLTHETENFTERYHAQVRAIVPNCCVSDWVRSSRFCPREDTNIGKPDVKYIPGLHSIKFLIQPPYTPLRDEENRTLTVVDVFNQLSIVVQYEITIFCQETQLKWTKTENDKEFEITDLDPDTEYNGTIHLKYSDKNSEPQVFRVRTLPDTSWLPYLFGMILFIIIFLFGTIYYLVYKYIKHHTVQKPTSLDFKDISRFQPLILNGEHVLSPYDLFKTIHHIPEVRPAEVRHHILNKLEHQNLFNPTEAAYQQQAKTSPFQSPVQHLGPADAPSIGYAPQVIKNNPLCPLEHNPSTLTYGLCMEGASGINKANHVIKLDSFVSSGPYKAQRPEWANKELQDSKAQQKPEVEVEDAPQIQHLPLPEDPIGLPQEFPCLLGEWVPVTIDGRTGSYRKQTELLSSSSNVGQNAISAGGDSLLSTMPPSLFSHCPSNSLPQDPSLGQQPAWNLLAWTDNFLPSKLYELQIADCSTRGCQELKSEPQSLGLIPNTLDSAEIHRPFPSLFRDLDLKLQWDCALEENTAAF